MLRRRSWPCREPDHGPTVAAEATVRRNLQRIDGDALDTALGSWLAGRERAASQEGNDSDRLLTSLTVDGKTVRGARRTDTPTHRHTDTPTHRHTDTPNSTCSPR